jgi:hypothetical protein
MHEKAGFHPIFPDFENTDGEPGVFGVVFTFMQA